MEGTDLASDIDQGFEDLANRIADVGALFSQGVFASRPAANSWGGGGAFYLATDTTVLYYTDGTTWYDFQDLLPPTEIVNADVSASAAIAYSKLSLSGSILNTDLDASSVLTPAGISSSVIRRGKSIIATSESTSSTSYTTLTTPDQVSSLVLPADGLIWVMLQATWKGTTSDCKAAIFLDSTQLKAATLNNLAPVTIEAGTGGSGNKWEVLCTTPANLITSYDTLADYSGDVTTGQVQGVIGSPADGASQRWRDSAGSYSPGGNSFLQGGAMAIFAAAGTYTISVKFQTPSGGDTVTVKDRKLWVWTMGF